MYMDDIFCIWFWGKITVFLKGRKLCKFIEYNREVYSWKLLYIGSLEEKLHALLKDKTITPFRTDHRWWQWSVALESTILPGHTWTSKALRTGRAESLSILVKITFCFFQSPLGKTLWTWRVSIANWAISYLSWKCFRLVWWQYNTGNERVLQRGEGFLFSHLPFGREPRKK